METQNATEMPRYRCHKEVWALKIAAVERKRADVKDGTDGSILLVFEDAAYTPKAFTEQFDLKHAPQVGGYYVVYKDGYQSFSPADAFEQGYTRI